MRLVYFARVREVIGEDGEQRDLPAGIVTVADCIDWLVDQGPAYADAMTDRSLLRFALDQQMVRGEAIIGDATELAIFPPVTGG